jgi:predicted acetyltransferase
MAAIHRVITADVGGEFEWRDFSVLGIADVAVTTSHRGRGLVRKLLSLMHTSYPNHDFAALLTDSPGIYRSSGYIQVNNIEWGMVRGLQLPTDQWPTGEIRLNGPTW